MIFGFFPDIHGLSRLLLSVLAIKDDLFLNFFAAAERNKISTSFSYYLSDVAKIGEISLSIGIDVMVNGVITVEQEFATVFLRENPQIGGKGVE
jgi:hypothetical protein